MSYWSRHFDECIESKFIEIDKKSTNEKRNTIIGVIYRPPNGNVQQFTQAVSGILDKIKKENRICYLLGDYNTNLFDIEKHLPTSEFIDSLFSYEFMPFINMPTRDTGETATLIDNIYCNHTTDSEIVGLLYTNITDHYSIIYINNKPTVEQSAPSYRRRIYSTRNVAGFVESLRNIIWSDVLNCYDPQDCYNIFKKDQRCVWN